MNTYIIHSSASSIAEDRSTISVLKNIISSTDQLDSQ